MPSVVLVGFSSGPRAGIKMVTLPSLALPMRIPGLTPRIGFRVRLVIGDVKDVVAVNVDSARPAELLLLSDEFAVRVENLDAIVTAVADENPALRIYSNGVRRIELAGGRAFPAPRLDEFPVLRELHDARI